ncbi:MAG: energy transducer TonB, partial [Methylotenera sp.]
MVTIKLTVMQSFLLKLKTMNAMAIALWSSVLLHLVLLSLHFEPELNKFKDNFAVLEVVLVNAKTQTQPDNTETYAQANLDRGGNTEQDRKMKTALPALKPQKSEPKPQPVISDKQVAQASLQKTSESRAQKRVAELEKQAQELMTQINAAKAVESQPTQKTAVQETQPGNQT